MSRLRYVDQASLLRFLSQLETNFNGRGRLHLVGEAIQVYEGWIPWAKRLEYAVTMNEEDRVELTNAVNGLKAEMEMDVLEEWPGGVL